MKLTPNFDLAEFTISQTASRLGLDNTPPPEVVERLKEVTAPCMERVRAILRKPCLISSGYRSAAVNRAVGGVKNSAHVDGYAVDFIAPAFGRPIDVVRALLEGGLKFDQIIEEGTWVHVSFAPAMRQQVLTKADHGYVQGIAA